MKLALRYALKDLRGALSSFRIVLLCLTLGIGAISAVQLTSHNVLSGIEKNGRSLLGGDLVIRNIYAPAPADLKKFLTDRQAVLTETVEARVMLANEVTFDNTLVELKAVATGYPLVGAVKARRTGQASAICHESVGYTLVRRHSDAAPRRRPAATRRQA